MRRLLPLFVKQLLLLFSIVTFTTVAQTSPQVYNATGTFTVPANIYQVTVEAWGGGGKGGSCMSQNGINVGGGGGGCAFASKSIAVTPGTTYTVTVGLGATTTAPGGDSWFINNTTILAKGGNSTDDNVKTGSTGGAAASCIGDLTASGGNGATGIDNVSGGGGGAGAESVDIGITPSAFDYRGAIATCFGGNGGDGYTSENGDGLPGSAPGGGGGGGRRNNNNGSNSGLGGFGGNGTVIIKWGTTTAPAVLTNGPGGVTADLQLWLRADLLDGTTSVTNNTNVTTWHSQARGSNATKPADVGAPIYRNNPTYNVNFNAVVDFTNDYSLPSQVYTDLNSSRQYLKGSSGFYTQESFVVVIPDVTVSSSLNSMDVFCGDRVACQEIDRTGIVFGNLDSRFTNEVLSYALGLSTTYGAAEISTTKQYNNIGIINSRSNLLNNGAQLYYNGIDLLPTEVNTATYRNVYDSQYWIGRSEAWDGSLDGRVAEIITFNARKNDLTERNKIESYLALKYGITLGVAGTSQNYVDSNAAIVWNAGANAGYNQNIAGIGRDDLSKLNQKQSKSVNSNAVLTIGLGTISTTNTANTNAFAVDKRFLVWGDNGGTMNDSGTDLVITFAGISNVTTLTDIPNKKWKIIETGGDVSTTKVAIAASSMSNLPALSGNDAYVMIVADDASFTTNVETVFLTANGLNLEADYDFDGTKYFTFGVAHESIYSRHSTFDGLDDVVKFDAVNNLSNSFTVMFWMRPTGQNTLIDERIIASKFDGATGYRIYLDTNHKINFTWTGGSAMISNATFQNPVWHNIVFIYSGSTLQLYVDGVLDRAIASTDPTSNSFNFSIGAEYQTKSNIKNYFYGDIDEFRLWNKALTLTEVKFIMNQEISQNGTGTKGTVLPSTLPKNDISTLDWSNLTAYYSMNSFIGTHINDDSSNNNRGNMFVPNKVTVTLQSAPMPYESSTDGLWSDASTWTNGSIQALPYGVSILDNATPIDWNIVRTNHHISSTGNKTLLGLIVNSRTLSANNNTKIEVSHYLKLEGKIDLVSKSQLIQTDNSYFEVTSAGSLERDQQGQSNTYNYNYWSSPVSTINNTTINHGYTIADVMKDGTTATPQNLNWSSGLNGSPTSPITLASYWIFKFQNLSNNYANWSGVGENGTLLAGQGYTLKGSAAVTVDQNYTYVGKPNNGTITSSVSANNLNLSGNPFASAIDADKFIDDNSSSIIGVLYFWEHYSTNSSHITAQYQGGYATYTKVGGTAPVAPSGISGLGSSSKIPKRYMPVGQGFFVTGSLSGGTITFNNSQRIFMKEDNASSYTLFRNNANQTANADPNNNNNDDSFTEAQFMKLRLGYNSADHYYRHILLGFMNENASPNFDNGYDALSIETLTNDMYFINGTAKLNIQGDGFFNPNNIYPLGVKNEIEGIVKFVVEDKKNFDENQNIFIYDDVSKIYHDIKSQAFEINLPAGTYETRFSLRFFNPSALGNNDPALHHSVAVTHSQTNNMININNQSLEISIESAALYNLLGQQVISWKLDSQNITTIHLPVSSVNAGAYIVKITTNKGDIKKKILVK